MQGQPPGLRSVKCLGLFPTSRPPFGKQMAGRNYSDESYRYGFNGKENDKDFGNQHLIQDYGFRLYNPEVGKFLSVDPLAPDYPWYTPYQFAGNTPIQTIDLDGAEEYYYSDEMFMRKYGIMADQMWNGAVDGLSNIVIIPILFNQELRYQLISIVAEREGYDISDIPYNVVNETFTVVKENREFKLKTKQTAFQGSVQLLSDVLASYSRIKTR
ncbi:RHS repeat-associated core domain-containing protein [Rapidithrix thailandica]|uniref:RHS repeat-associated core domain-containing protein n=1 Tax=Rapidithrix thailandica TaxID=413964 RepID=A0AAW9SIB3_9BACT